MEGGVCAGVWRGELLFGRCAACILRDQVAIGESLLSRWRATPAISSCSGGDKREEGRAREEFTSLACSLVNALGLVAVSSVSTAVVAVSGSVGAVVQEASPAEVSKRELVSMLGDRDRAV